MNENVRVTRATIISDASLCCATGAAGWAGWAKSDSAQTSRMWSGPLKTVPACSNEAELFAIANALHSACSAGMIEIGSEVMLQSDSVVALGYVLSRVEGVKLSPHENSSRVYASRKGRKLSENVITALDAISALVLARRLTLKVRHVRGHTVGDGRQYVNRQCDLAARAAMRALRKQKGEAHGIHAETERAL